MVAWLRICGDATASAASASRWYFCCTIGWLASSVRVVIAPISMPSDVLRTPLSSWTPLRSITAFGFLIRSLSQSRLSSPPARIQASSPCCSRSFCASASVAGCNSRNAGMTSCMTAMVSSRVGRQSHRPCTICGERVQDAVRGDWRAQHTAVPNGVLNRAQHRGAAGQSGDFADALRSDGIAWIGNVHGLPLHLQRHVEDRWRLVLIEPPREELPVGRLVDDVLGPRVSEALYPAA